MFRIAEESTHLYSTPRKPYIFPTRSAQKISETIRIFSEFILVGRDKQDAVDACVEMLEDLHLYGHESRFIQNM